MTRRPESDTLPPAETAAVADELAYARGILSHEAHSIRSLAQSLDSGFERAVDLICRCADRDGTLLISGLGKSGHIGAKMSATFASLGIPSHAVHPSEAAHGDLGRFRPTDLVICISYSGETHEVVNLAAILRQDSLPVISVTGGVPGGTPPSSLERLATVAIRLGITEEAGAPEYVAPTSSTTATLALGDALALTAARRRRFTDADFARRHPGGSLGGLLRPVTEIMRCKAGSTLTLIPDDATVQDALTLAAAGGRRPGALVLVERGSGRMTGIFTDGDLRRLILRGPAELAAPVSSVMTKMPRHLPDTALVRDAVHMFQEFRQDEVPVVDAAGRPVGLLDVQDLIAMRLVKD